MFPGWSRHGENVAFNQFQAFLKLPRQVVGVYGVPDKLDSKENLLAKLFG
jgi:hypothetical protein